MSVARSTSPLVVILIVTWNRRDLLMSCLASLQELEYAPYRCLVVDNGSEDDTIIEIERHFPDVMVLDAGQNLGFAAGNNLGFQKALEMGADYLFLLNNDTRVAPDSLRRLITVAEADSEIGIVAPTVYYWDEPDRIWSAGGQIDWKTGRAMRLFDGRQRWFLAAVEPVPVDFVSGCALAIKRDVLSQSGGFDPRFFMYYEEVEWCTRIVQAGYKVVWVPEASIWHKVSATLAPDSPSVAYYMHRNVLLFLRVAHHNNRMVGAILRQIWIQIRSLAATLVDKQQRHTSPSRLRALWDFARGKFGPISS